MGGSMSSEILVRDEKPLIFLRANYFKHDQNLKTLISNLEIQELNTNKMKTKYDFFFLKRKKKKKK
jgi:hypothetical protein